MSVRQVPVLAVSIVQSKIKMDWLDATWSEWGELQQSAELVALIGAADDKLTKSNSTQSKGKGKGPAASGGQSS